MGVHVSTATHFAHGGKQTPLDNLKGAEVNLDHTSNGTGAHYVGRNYLVAYDGEPIHPFILSVKSPSGDLNVRRSVKGDPIVPLEDLTSFERSMLGRWPYDISTRADTEGIADIGDLFPKDRNGNAITTSYDYIVDKIARMQQALADLKGKELSAEYVAIQFRLKDIMESMFKPGVPITPDNIVPNIRWIRYKFYCNYCHDVSGLITSATVPGAAGAVNRDQPWVIRYDAFVYDSDALAHFMSGDIYIPTEQ